MLCERGEGDIGKRGNLIMPPSYDNTVSTNSSIQSYGTLNLQGVQYHMTQVTVAIHVLITVQRQST